MARGTVPVPRDGVSTTSKAGAPSLETEHMRTEAGKLLLMRSPDLGRKLDSGLVITQDCGGGMARLAG